MPACYDRLGPGRARVLIRSWLQPTDRGVDALAEAGAHVVIVDCDAVLASEGLSFLRNKGHSAEAAIVDATVSNDVEELAADLDAKLGRLDVLVCNAGIARSGTSAEDVTDEQWMNVLDVDLNGVFWCCRAFGRRMLKRGAARS